MAAQAGTASHIDFKLVGKPQVFSGSESGWIEWRGGFQMKAYIVMSQMYNPTELTNTENRREVIDATALTGVDKRNSESLYYLLRLTSKGAAQTVLRRTPSGNGPEAWRQQHIRYGQKEMMSSMSMLQALLVFSFGSSVDQVPDRLVEFEALIMRYKAEPNVDALSDAIKKAVLVRRLSGTTQNTPADESADLRELRIHSGWCTILHRGETNMKIRSCTEASSSTDMEVDAVCKDGYKGKSKGGKGTSKNPPKGDESYICGKR